LLANLKQQFKKEPNRKVVIFSEYIDTVKYLAPVVSEVFKNRVLVVAGSLNDSKERQIKQNFDASYNEQKNDYDILLTSDKISEGFNLNRAGLVINYDIPWNPVRVIQRLGRINRIGQKIFDKIYIVNFFPTEQGATLVKSREIASNKMFLIHRTLGEDAKIFDIDEEPTPSGLYQRIQQNPDKLETESFYTKVLNEFEALKAEHPEVIESIKNCPPRVKVAKKFKEDELFVFIQKRRLYIQAFKYSSNQAEPVLLQDILAKIRCHKDEPSLPLGPQFWDAYKKTKEVKEPTIASNEQSLEQKAVNNLKTILNLNAETLIPYKAFLCTLLEDIIDYGTLPDYTLRRLINLETSKAKIADTVKELKALRQELGEGYLLQEKERLKSLQKEIIIAIENRNV